MKNTKIAAIWCRVSTHDQRELSLDSQEAAVRRTLEGLGYAVLPQYVLKVDWTSMDLMPCPEFQQLRGWIVNRDVQAVGVLDRDRLQAQGLQRLVFLSECKDNEVQIVTAQGPPMFDGPEGQLVELALAIGKERSVLRAQQGSRDGLRDRATLRGLPAVPQNPYGYRWDEARTRLTPTSDWSHAEFICQSALAGTALRTIVKQLHDRSIPSPKGREWWAPRTVYGLLTNPLYGGRYYALRHRSSEPKQRRTQGYGKTSHQVKPVAESIHLGNIVIERPPLAWDEWLEIQDRFKTSKLQAHRHAKRDYLLRSVIVCDTHRRRYSGRTKGDRWIYSCSKTLEPEHHPCPRPRLPGPTLEAHLKGICRRVLESPEVLEQEIKSRTGMVESSRHVLQRNLDALDRKSTANVDAETNLALEKARGNVSAEAYERALARVKAERTWITEERQRLTAQLETLEHGHAALLGLAQAREQLATKLESADTGHWRTIFNALGVETHVTEDGAIEVGLAIPVEPGSIVLRTPRASLSVPLATFVERKIKGMRLPQRAKPLNRGKCGGFERSH